MAVFLSYAHEDADEVETLRGELEELAGPVWLDRGLTGGQVWWDEILAQLRDCSLFVLALSNGSVRSEACLAEASYVLALRRPFLAVRVADLDFEAAPEEIRRTQVIDFTARSIDSVRGLAKAVLRVQAPDPLPDPLPNPPPMPQSYRDRFAEVFAANLDLDHQLSLFARLRFDFENQINAIEASALLRRLYERADLSWKLRDEIAALLVIPIENSSPPAKGASPTPIGEHSPSKERTTSEHPPPPSVPRADLTNVGRSVDASTRGKPKARVKKPKVEVVSQTWNTVQCKVTLSDCKFRLRHKVGWNSAEVTIQVEESPAWSSKILVPFKEVNASGLGWTASAGELTSPNARHVVIYASTGLTSISWILLVDGIEIHQRGKAPPSELRDQISAAMTPEA